MIIPFFAGDLREVSPSVLAYVGDAVYELYARCWVADHFSSKSGKMHSVTIKYVSAEAQASAIRILEKELTEQEDSFFRRGKNSNPASKSKNASPADYMYATGFEALIGYLFLDNQNSRLEYLISKAFEVLDHPEEFLRSESDEE